MGGWVGEKKAVGMRCCGWVGGWVGGWDGYLHWLGLLHGDQEVPSNDREDVDRVEVGPGLSGWVGGLGFL